MSTEGKKEELYLGIYRQDDEGKYYNARLFDRTGMLSYPIDIADGSLVFKQEHVSPQVDMSTINFKEGKTSRNLPKDK